MRSRKVWSPGVLIDWPDEVYPPGAEWGLGRRLTEANPIDQFLDLVLALTSVGTWIAWKIVRAHAVHMGFTRTQAEECLGNWYSLDVIEFSAWGGDDGCSPPTGLHDVDYIRVLQYADDKSNVVCRVIIRALEVFS